MSFMQTEIIFGKYYKIETLDGIYFLPADVHPNAILPIDLKDYLETTSDLADCTLSHHEGYLGRMFAPGYMDCTDWIPGKNSEELEATLKEMYGDDE